MVFGLLERLQAQGATIQVREVDITKQPDVVPRYGIVTTPSMAIDGQLEFTGVPAEGKLLARLQERGVMLGSQPEVQAPLGLLGRLRALFR